MSKALYIHLPFCRHICDYCDFFRVKVNPLLITRYIEQLIVDIQKLDDDIKTIYLGGGTPSALSVSEIQPLLLALLRFKPLEFTIECNPESLDEEKIVCYQAFGINRISLGVQSCQDHFLQVLGRKHSFKQVQAVLKLLQNYHFENVSIDLMYGLPNQTLADLEADLEAYLALDLPHISIYSLTIEPNSRFASQGIKATPSILETQMYQLIYSKLTQAGYQHYEIASFCKNGYQSQHNLSYWRYDDFIGIGCHASGKEGQRRYTNQANIKNYLDGRREFEENLDLSVNDQMFEMVMMGLRLQEGVCKAKFVRRFGKTLEAVYETAIKRHQPYFVKDDAYLRLNEDGRLILMDILIDFMED